MVMVLSSQRGTVARGFTVRDPTRGHLSSALRRARQYEVSAGTGPGNAPERWALAALVRGGRISRREADEFLAARYPGAPYGAGRFGDQALPLAVIAGKPLEEVQGAAGVGLGDELRVGRLPESYEQNAVQDVIEGLAEGMSERVNALRSKPPEFPAHSLNGEALAPGTVPPEALDLKEVGRKLLAWPNAAEAIEIDLAQSATMDRWIRRAATGVSGPGRIWEARAPSASPGARIGMGPARYRLVRPGQRFGVMSCRLPPTADMMANNTPGILFQYGIVVTRIPHYLGRPPSRILAAEAVGDAPTSLRTSFGTGGWTGWTSGGTTRDFWWSRTTQEHLTLAPYPFADAFGADANLVPSGANLRDIFGFTFQLVTGRDGGEVFRQLCSRFTLGRTLRFDGHGHSASIPGGLVQEAPTVGSVVDWQGAADYTHRVDGYDLTTAGTRLVIGVPFSYDDCASLVPTDTHFSVVIQPVGERILAQGGLASLATPEEWHRNGLEVAGSVSGRLRTWALDVIVG